SEEDESDVKTESDEEKTTKRPKTAAGKRQDTGGKGAKDKKAESDSEDSDEDGAKKKPRGKDGEDSDSSARSEPDTKEKSGKKQSVAKEDHPSILRLKKYILTCGARRNYKKLFQNCRSVKAMVEVLKKELEDLGVKGNPSLEKCRVVRLKREEAAELAELDTGNIIATAGRPRRRNTWNPYKASPIREDSPYRKTMGSDSEGEGPPRKKRPMDWSSLRGIISDDGDSD
ncbi:HIRA-interacting protein 3-like, partial [Anomaloglossus baeobatrachus]